MPIILLIHVYPVKILIIPKNVKRSPPPRMTSSERRFYYEKIRKRKTINTAFVAAPSL